MTGPVPGPWRVTRTGVDPARVRSLTLFVHTFPDAPPVRVRYREVPDGWRWRCDRCGQWREPVCPHCKAAQGALSNNTTTTNTGGIVTETPRPAPGIDWKAEARKWEGRAKENNATAERLVGELATEREKCRIWRTSYHSLRLSLEGRLDRIAELLEDTEWEPEMTASSTTSGAAQ